MNENATRIQKLTLAAVCLALCLALPFLTANIPEIGNALCPMHIPVFLCAFVCGPWWAMGVGAMAPLVRFLLVGMPPLFPTGLAMCFELAAYGAIAGLMYARLPKKTQYIYVSLLCAMLGGRIVWGVARVLMSGVSGAAFTWAAFMAGAFTNAIPGMVVHVLLIPVIVLALRRALPWMKQK
ncbi:MAG: ECF transporter S component [Clostridia bacterium]|nr:ECF transporter S component [Clostridia bacterium]